MTIVTDIPGMHRRIPTSGNTRHAWIWSAGFRTLATVSAIVVSLLCLCDVRAYATPAAYGIDISHYNTVTDPAAIAGNGITFAYVKVTEGTSYVDPTFPLHTGQLRGVGIKVGGYHFADGPDCAGEARWFHQQLTTQQLLDTGALMPMLDMETPSLAAGADACVRAFYDQLGSTALLVYGNATWWSLYLHPDTWGGRAILGWIARYNGDPGNPGTSAPILAIHQHTDQGTVPGIAGYVDRDALMPGRTLAELVLGGPTVPAPVATPAPAPVPTPLPTRTLHIVVAGDTLSAIAAAWHTSWPAVAAANGLANPDLIYPGERIYRPSSSIVAVLPSFGGSHLHLVRSGETLSGIANQLHYPGGWPALARHNHLHNPNLIYPGERLAV